MLERPATADEKTKQTSGSALFTIIALICAVGIGISVELTMTHYSTHTNPKYHAVCDINETMSCTTVAQSPFSVFLRVPVSVWGILGYAIMGALALTGLKRRFRFHDTWPSGLLFLLFLFSVATSATLGYISFTRIDALCIFCLSLYFMTALLFALGVALLIRLRKGPLRAALDDLRALLSRPKLAVGLGAPLGAFVVSLVLFFPPYWQHARWGDLPDLPTGVDRDGHHWIGAKDPLVTIVEFSDYQCPYCRRAHKEARLLASKYPRSVRLIHRHLPLDMACNERVRHSFHERACEFSKAVECAAAQGMFWAMNDALFSVQDLVRASAVDLERLAVQLGVDRSSFNACMEKPDFPKRIMEDLEESGKLGIQGTPTFLVGNRSMPGGVTETVLEQVLAEAKAGASK